MISCAYWKQMWNLEMRIEVIIPLHVEGEELFFSEIRWKIMLYRQQISFYDVEFSLDFFPQPSN